VTFQISCSKKLILRQLSGEALVPSLHDDQSYDGEDSYDSRGNCDDDPHVDACALVVLVFGLRIRLRVRSWRRSRRSRRSRRRRRSGLRRVVRVSELPSVHLSERRPVSIDRESVIVVVEHQVVLLQEEISEEEGIEVAREAVNEQLAVALVVGIKAVHHVGQRAHLIGSVGRDVELQIVEVSDVAGAVAREAASLLGVIALQVGHVGGRGPVGDEVGPLGRRNHEPRVERIIESEVGDAVVEKVAAIEEPSKVG